MADNHWINVDGGNLSTAANWSLGHAPTYNENAIFDCAFNASKTVTADSVQVACADFNFTGATGSPTFLTGQGANYEPVVYGNITLIAGMTFTKGAYYAFQLKGTNHTCSITSAGKSIGSPTGNNGIIINDINITFNLLDDYSGSGLSFISTGSVLTTNNHAMNVNYMAPATVNLGSSAITIQATLSSFGVTTACSANTATVTILGNGAFGGSINFNGLTLNLNGTAHTLSGSPTGIAGLNFKPAGAQTITWTSGATTHVTTMIRTGSGVITWVASSTGTYALVFDGAPQKLSNMSVSKCVVT